MIQAPGQFLVLCLTYLDVGVVCKFSCFLSFLLLKDLLLMDKALLGLA